MGHKIALLRVHIGFSTATGPSIKLVVQTQSNGLSIDGLI